MKVCKHEVTEVNHGPFGLVLYDGPTASIVRDGQWSFHIYPKPKFTLINAVIRFDALRKHYVGNMYGQDR